MSNTDTKRLIVGGDWNITLQPIDKRGGIPWKSTTVRDLAKWIERVKTKASNAPDHRAVRLTISIAQVSRGPGLWKFNNSLLGDEEYVD